MSRTMEPHAAREPSPFTLALDATWSILLFEQHRFTQGMTGAIRDLKSSTNIAEATGALVILSFFYGLLHAAGPGHGKAVISSYMLADKETLRRGILLAFLSSLIQAFSAIVLIGGLYAAAVATGLQTKWAEAWLETLSWGFIALVGAGFLFKQLRPMVLGRRKASQAHNPAEHDHGRGQLFRSRGFHDAEHVRIRASAHDHGHEHDSPAQAAAAPDSNMKTRSACGCGRDHVHDERCSHAYLPVAGELKGDLTLGRALAIAFSIGIRPCTGALLVISFAASQGMIWAGVLATFAMSLGTAMTVSALAALSVGSRRLAIALAGTETQRGQLIAQSASIVSSAAVFVLGTAFFFASFHDVRPF